MSESIIFTLYEGNYDYGVGALINSAHKCEFKGKIIIGYKDSLPFWINQFTKRDDLYVMTTESGTIELIFKEISIDYHLRYFKPSMFKILFAEYPKSKIFYFDPDITLIGDWKYFDQWVNYGVACILDENYPLMPYSHPLKQKWAEIFNYTINHSTPFNLYINSGFIGCKIANIELINKWENNILFVKEKGGNLKDFNPVFNQSFRKKRLNSIIGDQDILNATINDNHLQYNLSIVGPEGMGFIPAGYLMYHNTGKKTWNKNFLFEFLKTGNKISLADDSFLENSQYPIVLFSKYKKIRMKILLSITKLLQRIL